MHESEHEFADEVEALLIAALGHEPVYRQYRYETDRVVDFLVRGPLLTYVLEVENDADSIIAARGQVQTYADHHPNGRAVPVIVVPDGHKLADPELDYVQTDVAVLDTSDLKARLEAWTLSQESDT